MTALNTRLHNSESDPTLRPLLPFPILFTSVTKPITHFSITVAQLVPFARSFSLQYFRPVYNVTSDNALNTLFISIRSFSLQYFLPVYSITSDNTFYTLLYNHDSALIPCPLCRVSPDQHTYHRITYHSITVLPSFLLTQTLIPRISGSSSPTIRYLPLSSPISCTYVSSRYSSLPP